MSIFQNRSRQHASSYKELKMDCPIQRVTLQKDSSYKFQFFTKLCESPRMVFQVQDIWENHKYTEKCSDFIQNTGISCKSKLISIKLKAMYINNTKN